MAVLEVKEWKEFDWSLENYFSLTSNRFHKDSGQILVNNQATQVGKQCIPVYSRD